MPTTQLSQIATLPDKCPMTEIQGKMIAVYEVQSIAGKSKQNFTLQDASGTTAYGSAWEHPDLSVYKDREVVIRAGAKGGLTVNVYKGKAGFNVSRTTTFQFLEVHTAQTGGAQNPVAASPAPAAYSGVIESIGTKPINGQTVGMAVKAAIDVLIASGHPLSKKEIWSIASKIIRVSQYIEKGNLDPDTEPNAKTVASDKPEDDIPF